MIVTAAATGYILVGDWFLVWFGVFLVFLFRVNIDPYVYDVKS